MGKKKIIGVVIFVLILAGLFLTFPIKVYSDNLNSSGLTVIEKKFNVNGLRDRLYIKMQIVLTGAVNITIYSPKNETVYSKALGSTGDQINITAKVVANGWGTYKIVFLLFGSLQGKVVIVAYNQFMDPILKYVS